MPKTIAMQAYLVTTIIVTVLLAIVGYIYADEKRQHIFLSQELKLTEITTVLAQRLNSDGLMALYEEAVRPDESIRRAMRAVLQPIVEVVGQQYPGFAMGYSLRDSRLAMYPYRHELIMKPYPAEIIDEYKEKRTLDVTTDFKSTLSNEKTMRIRCPIMKDEKTLGHIWVTIPMTSVNNAVYQAWRDIFFILLAAWLSLMLVLKKVFTGFDTTLAHVADKIIRQDDNIDLQKIPQLQPVLMAVTSLRNSLQEKETAYRTLVENSPDIMIRHDINGQRVYTNPVYAQHINPDYSYYVGDRVFSRGGFIQYKDERARNVAVIGNRVEFEYKRHLMFGGTTCFKCTLVPERDESGQVASVLDVSRDITDIKEAGELFLAVFNLSPNCSILTRQKDGTIIRVNDTFLKGTGLSSDSVVGRTIAELDLWQEADKYQESRALLLRQGYLNSYEAQLTIQGRLRTVLLSIRNITINREPCWLHVVTDITEKKLLDAELARFDSLNLVGEMAASIGHEVRNPMTTVRGYLQMFQRKAEFASHGERLTTMIEEIDRANAIITEFLSLAKNKNTKLEQGNLNTVVKALYPLLLADALRMGHQLEVITSAIPDTVFDESEIRKLILNLFRNAMEAMEIFGVARIGTYYDNADDAVVLEVSDTGKGILPEIRDKLGTPFFTTKENGTGLGLAVCYRVAQRHGATINIDSSPAGTKFSIRFQAVKGT